MPRGDYDPEAVERKWQERWVEAETYTYEGDGTTDPDTVFSIDSPPPTVSGSLHWGHVYGFTLQDFTARYNRMAGKEVFFPFGYDDNGIASERLTEDELDVRHQEYDRHEFQELCREVCTKYEAEFTDKMQNLGISIDWSETYQTIAPEVQRISQLSFVDLYEQGREYRKRAPAIWCPECETAISQVEMEDEEHDSHFHDIRFDVAGSDDSFVIATTRPELLPACVAVFVHPNDDAHAHLVGEAAKVPLFGQEVPIIEDERVDLETGSGVVMCCTFGDQTDIEWYQAHDLDLRIAIDESGTMTDVADEYAGLGSDEAGAAIVEALDDAGHLLDRRPITHTVNVHERCGTGVEFLVTEQWYIELLDKTDEYLAAGREMDWYPEKMFTRYRNWIEGLQWDWSISRQRSSGIPFPVWYCADCDGEVVADREQLPVDPLEDAPPVATCPECGGEEFRPEDDVLDTWATSSLTPLINAGWGWDGEEFTLDRPELYPMDMRPQGHDIISFWLFHTVVKCYEHTGEVPFDSVMINGMVLDENREKMSKSKGNVVTPDEVLAEFPVDAARYWAAGSSVGDDLPYKEKGLRAGERLLRKLWNASKLVDDLTPDERLDRPDLEALDRWLLAEMDELVADLTDRFERREFSKARDRLRSFFWHTFCDDYLEVAKQRVRAAESEGAGPADPAAAYTLQVAHERFCRLFAPILAHATEEIWTEMHGDGGSVHRTDWPTPLGIDADREAGATAMAVVGALRRYKSERQLPLNAPLASVTVHGDVSGFEDDIRRVMHVENLETTDVEADVETVVTGIDLDYATVGPAYGETVSEIENAIEAGEYTLTDDRLRVAGVELDAEMFEVEAERRFTGDGEMVEADDTVVVVRSGAET
jgi:valyl-tRNA synthetase